MKNRNEKDGLAALGRRHFGIGYAGHPEWEAMVSDPAYRERELTAIYRGRAPVAAAAPWAARWLCASAGLLALLMLSSCATLPTWCPMSQSSPRATGPGQQIARTAEKWVGKKYRPGKPRQCANFVAEVVREAGAPAPPKNAPMARAWLAWGRAVPLSQAQPGDVVVLWRGSPRGRAGHILVVTGKNEAVHRSTYKSPVKRVPVSAYHGRILGVRRAA